MKFSKVLKKLVFFSLLIAPMVSNAVIIKTGSIITTSMVSNEGRIKNGFLVLSNYTNERIIGRTITSTCSDDNYCDNSSLIEPRSKMGWPLVLGENNTLLLVVQFLPDTMPFTKLVTLYDDRIKHCVFRYSKPHISCN